MKKTISILLVTAIIASSFVGILNHKKISAIKAFTKSFNQQHEDITINYGATAFNIKNLLQKKITLKNITINTDFLGENPLIIGKLTIPSHDIVNGKGSFSIHAENIHFQSLNDALKVFAKYQAKKHPDFSYNPYVLPMIAGFNDSNFSKDAALNVTIDFDNTTHVLTINGALNGSNMSGEIQYTIADVYFKPTDTIEHTIQLALTNGKVMKSISASNMNINIKKNDGAAAKNILSALNYEQLNIKFSVSSNVAFTGFTQGKEPTQFSDIKSVITVDLSINDNTINSSTTILANRPAISLTQSFTQMADILNKTQANKSLQHNTFFASHETSIHNKDLINKLISSFSRQEGLSLEQTYALINQSIDDYIPQTEIPQIHTLANNLKIFIKNPNTLNLTLHPQHPVALSDIMSNIDEGSTNTNACQQEVKTTSTDDALNQLNKHCSALKTKNITELLNMLGFESAVA